MEEERTAHSEGTKSSSFWKWVARLFLIFLLSLIGTQIVLQYYADEIFGRIIREVVERRSDYLYTITYDKMSFNFVKGELTIEEMSLSPNRKLFYDSLSKRWATKNQVFEASIPKIAVRGLNLYDIYTKQAVVLKGIHVEKPSVTAFMNYQTPEEGEGTDTIRAPVSILSERVKYFLASRIKLSEAKFQAYTLKEDNIFTWNIKDISADAINLLIDSASLQPNSQPFTLEDLHITVRANRLELPNSPYTLGFSNLEFSTYGGLLDVNDFQIECSKEGKRQVANGGKYSVFECEIPFLKGRGVDFRAAYFNREIQMQKFFLENPNIRVYRKGSTKGRSPRSIYPKLSKVVKGVRLQQVFLNDASLATHWLPKVSGGMPSTIRHISGSLKEFKVNQATHESRVRFFYIDEADLTIRGYKQALPGREHALSANEIQISTEKESLLLRGLHVSRLHSPEERKSKDSTQSFGSLSLHIPLVKAQGMDIKKAYINRAFDLDYLLLYQPTIDLFHYSADSLVPNQADSLIRIRDLYPYVKSFTKDVNIGFLDIKESAFHFEQHWYDQDYAISLDSLSLGVKQWRISEALRPNPKALFNAKSIMASWQRFHAMRPDSLYAIDIGKGRISQEDSLLELHRFQLSPQLSQFERLPLHQRHPKALEVSAKYLKIDSLDFAQAYYEGIADIHTFLVEKPQIRWQQLGGTYDPQLSDLSLEDRLQTVLSRNFQSLRISNLKVNNGQWETNRRDSLKGFQVANLMLGVRGLRIDSATLADPTVIFRLDTLQVSTNAFYWPLPDQIHGLHIGKIGVKTGEQKVFFRGVALDTIANLNGQQQRDKTLFHARVPYLEWQGLKLNDLYYKDRLQAKSAAIPKAKLTIDWHRQASMGNASPPNLDSLYWMILHPLQQAHLGQVLLDSLELEIRDKETQELWHAGRWNMKVDNWKLDATSKMDSTHFLYADNIRLGVKELMQQIGDSLYQVNASTLSLDLKDKVFIGQEIVGKPLKFSSQQIDAHVQLPQIKATGLNIYRWYRQGNIELDTLRLSDPTIALDLPYVPETDRNRQYSLFNWRELPQYLPESIPAVAVKSLEVDTANILVQRYSKLDSTGLDSTVIYDNALYHLPEATMHITNLQVDTLKQSANKFLFSESVDFTLANQRLEMEDSLHYIRFDTLHVSTSKESLQLKNIQFRPLDTMDTYFQKIGYETDWIDVQAQEIALQDWKIQRFVETGDFYAKKLEINKLYTDIFRDKNIEDREKYYPPLPRPILNRLLFILELDSIVVSDGYARYREVPIDATEAGVVTVSDIEGTILNLTNEPFQQKKWGRIKINSSLKLMEEGKITTVFDLPYGTPNGNYSYQGKMDEMDLTSLNKILTPIANIKIRSGQANSASFMVAGDNDYATGVMRLKYNDLKILVINPEKDSNAGLLSFLANTFVVNRSNPHHLIFMKKGKIFFRRNREKSLIHYWIKSLLSGVKHSIGIKSQEKIPDSVKGDFLDSVLKQFKAEGRKDRRLKKEREQEMRKQLEEE